MAVLFFHLHGCVCSRDLQHCCTQMAQQMRVRTMSKEGDVYLFIHPYPCLCRRFDEALEAAREGERMKELKLHTVWAAY